MLENQTVSIIQGFLQGMLGWSNLTEVQINEIKVLLDEIKNVK